MRISIRVFSFVTVVTGLLAVVVSISSAQQPAIQEQLTQEEPQVRLIFPKQALDKEMLEALTGKSMPEKLAYEGKKAVRDEKEVLDVDVGTLLKYFKGKGFEVDQIELWVSGVAESGKVLRLAIAIKGEGGVKILLKPLK
jgi:hypothetical protein